MLLLLKPFSPLWICGEFLNFNGTTDLPLGIIVNKYIVFHCQFEVWDLFTHPPEEKSWEKHDTLTRCVWDLSQRAFTHRMVSMISWAASWCLSWKQGGTLRYTFPKNTNVRMINSTFTRMTQTENHQCRDRWITFEKNKYILEKSTWNLEACSWKQLFSAVKPNPP